MSRRGTALGRALLCALLAATAAPAAAAAPPAPPRALSPTERLDRAKELFNRGNELLQEGRREEALDHFLRSRELVPSYGNTRNAANCLDILGRHDEALAMYEALLDGFGAELDREDRAVVDRRMAELEAGMGALVIEANVDGEVLLDDRPRARLPLDRPLRVMGGRRRLRVVRAGYEPFETTVDIKPRVPMLVEARLRPALPDEAPPPPPPPPSAFAPGWFFEAFGGYAAGPNLGSDAEAAAAANCPSGRCPGAGGPWIGVRGGYLLESGLAFELSGAFLDLASSFRRSIDIPEPGEATSLGSYQLDHRVLLRQSLLGVGISYHLPIAWRLSGLARMTVALGSAQAADDVRGVAVDTDGRSFGPVSISGRERTLRAAAGLVIPELGLEASWGPLRAGLSVGLLISPSAGPRHGRRVIGVSGPCDVPGMSASLPLSCAPDSAGIANERAYGPFLLWVPQLSVAASF